MLSFWIVSSCEELLHTSTYLPTLLIFPASSSLPSPGHNSHIFLSIYDNFSDFFPFLSSQPVSGAVQCVACCNVAPRPPQGVRDGQGKREEMRVFKQITSLLYFVSLGSQFPRFFISKFSHFIRFTVHVEAEKQGSGMHRLSKGQVHK